MTDVLLRDQPPAGTGPDTWLPVTEAVVDRILAIDDPALRNLWITQSYADLGERLLAVTETDQTWCSFATWASNTAGISIRGHELPHFVAELLRGGDHHVDALTAHANRRLWAWRRFGLAGRVDRATVERLVTRALGQVSRHIAHGNTLVYAELAPLFVRLVERLESGDRAEPAGDVDALLDEIGIPARDDEPLVHLAFRSYVLAASTPDGHERAQLVLTANIAAVLHEQERLQDDIAASLNAGVLELGDELRLLPHPRLPHSLQRWLTRAVQREIGEHAAHVWDHVATGLLMTLVLPGEILHLGRDVPPLDDGIRFPPPLQVVSHHQLRRLMDDWDPTDGTGRGSAAWDWTDLRQRMGYIVNLFRSRQREYTLTSPPFTPDELAIMQRGEMPPLPD